MLHPGITCDCSLGGLYCARPGIKVTMEGINFCARITSNDIGYGWGDFQGEKFEFIVLPGSLDQPGRSLYDLLFNNWKIAERDYFRFLHGYFFENDKYANNEMRLDLVHLSEAQLNEHRD